MIPLQIYYDKKYESFLNLWQVKYTVIDFEPTTRKIFTVFQHKDFTLYLVSRDFCFYDRLTKPNKLKICIEKDKSGYFNFDTEKQADDFINFTKECVNRYNENKLNYHVKDLFKLL